MTRMTTCLLLLLLFFSACDKKTILEDSDTDRKKPVERAVFKITPLKWYNGKTAAVSMTYDGRWGHWKWQHMFEYVLNAAYVRKLAIDFEFVTANFMEDKYEFIREDIRNRAMKLGVHFYGHGHTHSYHDSLSYRESFLSFRHCFYYLDKWGMEPRAYAYPYGAGRKPETQQAVKDAGFICARGLTTDPSLYYICPDDESEPENWYYLPTIPVAENKDGYIGTHSGMAPIFETAIERSSWIIIMYHAIGFPEDWGYYPMSEYLSDVGKLHQLDFWGGNMDMVACYIKERNAFTCEFLSVIEDSDTIEYEIVFSDGLENSVYSQPLTLECNFDSNVNVESIEILSGDEIVTVATIDGATARFNIIPDEKTYRMRITKAAIAE